MSNKMNRRQFVRTTLAGTAAAGLALKGALGAEEQPFDPKDLPTRPFGKVGIRVPLLGFGTGGRWLSNQNDEDALGLLEYALDHGVFYWDTAGQYENDRISSEERIGRLLPSRRKEVFLVSKVNERSADATKASIERSLKRLRTDYIDLMHVHSIQSVSDAESIGPALDVLRQYKEEGVIRHIGFTGHKTAAGMKRVAERHDDFEAMMIALNHVEHLDWVGVDDEPFEEMAAPYAAEQGLGVVAMKVIAPRMSSSEVSPEDLLRYALSNSLFSLAVVSMNTMEQVKENLRIVRSFQPLSPERLNEVRTSLESFYRGERLAWMDPHYRDGVSSQLSSQGLA
ncbi:MAG: aldo/keto reductase [Candidatus Hydrogenedentota bacterium]